MKTENSRNPDAFTIVATFQAIVWAVVEGGKNQSMLAEVALIEVLRWERMCYVVEQQGIWDNYQVMCEEHGLSITMFF